MQPAATPELSRTGHLAGFASSVPGHVLIGLGATAAVAAAAHVALPLPFTPVPLTLQPLAVLGVGLALGPVGGFLTLLAYLAEGVCGLPVFAPTGLMGVTGFAHLAGPTGGFLLAYPLVAAVAGSVTERLASRIPRFQAALVGCTLATILLFVSGAAWLMDLAHLSVHATWIAAVAPFLPGELVKIVIAAGVYRALSPSATGKADVRTTESTG